MEADELYCELASKITMWLMRNRIFQEEYDHFIISLFAYLFNIIQFLFVPQLFGLFCFGNYFHVIFTMMKRILYFQITIGLYKPVLPGGENVIYCSRGTIGWNIIFTSWCTIVLLLSMKRISTIIATQTLIGASVDCGDRSIWYIMFDV